MTIIACNDCGKHIRDELEWRCHACGGSLDLRDLPPFDPRAIDPGDFSLWRYAAMLGIEKRFSLGEGMTPLVEMRQADQRYHAKLDYLNPTGSYKDRGTAVMLNYLAGFDVPAVIDNSSGNAGASIAAYASLAGMRARIYVPAASAVESKKRLIRAFGGTIVAADDPISDVYAAAETTTYASHAWSPWFALGQMTAAWEIWEQLDQRAPDAVATPVGHGGLFLGCYRGFRSLLEAGLIERMPRMIALQSAGVDPIVRSWERGERLHRRITPGTSIADGILVAEPVRGAQILAAIYETDGFALRAEDAAISRAQSDLASQGLLVEATSAITLACLPRICQRIGREAALVLALTGSGLKSLA